MIQSSLKYKVYTVIYHFKKNLKNQSSYTR
ncbi:hypothetical protein SAMN05421509_108110 [Chromohalobacter canadensis]|uniref:Uncharacterized protein n=1 Tax=Chromohalobacter canadensis TaxID=141389 RepID=A0A285VSS4_9GAMM|nr:hypothetical protein SAMN05421509_108110 [Chromohalobacter canadensis]